MNTKTDDAEERVAVANEILRQLTRGRGAGVLQVMIGAKHFIALPNGVRFAHMRAPHSANATRCEIRLDASDTYTVILYRADRYNLKTIEVDRVEGVYCDQLARTFESMTGLVTSLSGG